MSIEETEMATLDERDYEVLNAMRAGRANPLLVRKRTDLDKGDVNTVLVRLGRSGYVEQITRGLYEITDKGRNELRDRRSKQKSWIFHNELTEADLETFPQQAGELDQESEYYTRLLLGVTDDERAFYLDKVEQEIIEITTDDGGLAEIESRPVGELLGDSFADRMMKYILAQKEQRGWDRWSQYALALSFAESMKSIGPNFLTNEERIGYSFRIVFDLSMHEVMAFVGSESESKDEFSNTALKKMKESRKLREWLDDFGLPSNKDEM